jgi:ubiquinone/menaquinone biosynthesis C-methylase UbiE
MISAVKEFSVSKKPHGAGKSSIDLVDIDLLFNELDLQKDSVFLDVACGAGAYTLAASKIIDDSGQIHAFDLWEQGIDALKQQARSNNITNIEACIADVSEHIPLENGSIDIALTAMVLHDLMRDHTETGALKELRRVIKDHGKLCVIEFKKMDGPPGPPIEIRLSPEKLEELLVPYGFRSLKSLDLGPFSYLSVFTLT